MSITYNGKNELDCLRIIAANATGGGGGGATIADTTNLIAGDNAGNGVDSMVQTDGSGHIKGSNGTASAGVLNMDGAVTMPDIGVGGSIRTFGSSSNGGNIDTSGSSSSSGRDGGNITTNGVNSPGGSINTANGGGSIDTTGTGAIGLGDSGTRTTVTGTATTPRAISFPDSDGVVSLGISITPESGWATPASTGNKATILTNYDTAGLAAAAALVGLGDTNTQVGELTDVLQALITKLRANGVLTS